MAHIVVKHLPYDTTEADLRELVGDIGEIVSIELPRDSITGHAKPTATIELSTGPEAEDAVGRLNHSDLRGHRLVVTHAEEASLAEGEPMTEVEAPHTQDQSLPPHPHRPVREQGRDPGRWGH